MLYLKEIYEISESICAERIDQALSQLSNLIDDVDEILAGHLNIQSADEQYEDPEMWDCNEVLHVLKSSYKKLAYLDLMIEDGADEDEQSQVTWESFMILSNFLKEKGYINE